jgi:hypothetical protein
MTLKSFTIREWKMLNTRQQLKTKLRQILINSDSWERLIVLARDSWKILTKEDLMKDDRHINLDRPTKRAGMPSLGLDIEPRKKEIQEKMKEKWLIF